MTLQVWRERSCKAEVLGAPGTEIFTDLKAGASQDQVWGQQTRVMGTAQCSIRTAGQHPLVPHSLAAGVQGRSLLRSLLPLCSAFSHPLAWALGCFFKEFFFFFFIYTIFKVFIEFVTLLFLFNGLLFPMEACGISASWPGIEAPPPAWEGGVLTTGPPGSPSSAL